ncbi:MAG TPA: cupin domain-containing protein [Candidatus Lokiarchaeia archaeon]|nr:cupin domain-containing protein [Candidatus Lokiarchaeia archaeon]
MAEPIILKDYIEYSPESVVSKALVQNAAGSITLFSFDAGQGLSEHSAPYDAFVQVIDGEGKIIIEGEEHVLTEGQLIIMPAQVPHAVQADQPFKMLLTMLRAEE